MFWKVLVKNKHFIELFFHRAKLTKTFFAFYAASKLVLQLDILMKMHTNHLCLKGDTFKFQVQSRLDDYRALAFFSFFFLLVASNCPNVTPWKFCFQARTSDNLLWQSVTPRSIFVNGAGSRGQSLTEVEGRINGENKGILPVEQRAAGFCCVPAGWSLHTLRLRLPVKSYTAAAVSAKTRGKDKNTSKADYAFEELSFKTCASAYFCWSENFLRSYK